MRRGLILPGKKKGDQRSECEAGKGRSSDSTPFVPEQPEAFDPLCRCSIAGRISGLRGSRHTKEWGFGRKLGTGLGCGRGQGFFNFSASEGLGET